eukprot:g2245.t1
MVKTVPDVRLWSCIMSFVVLDIVPIGPSFSDLTTWWTLGATDSDLIYFTLYGSVLTLFGLSMWSFRRNGDHGSAGPLLEKQLSSVCRVLIFCITNAAIEEAMFRGVIMTAQLTKGGRSAVSSLVGAIAGFLVCIAIGFHHFDHARPKKRRGRPALSSSPARGGTLSFLLLMGTIAMAFVLAPLLWRGGWRSEHLFRYGFEELVAVAVQALLFAELHRTGGFPCGIFGFAMTFVWAFLLGLLRIRTEGMALCYLSHVIGDFGVGMLIYGVHKGYLWPEFGMDRRLGRSKKES